MEKIWKSPLQEPAGPPETSFPYLFHIFGNPQGGGGEAAAPCGARPEAALPKRYGKDIKKMSAGLPLVWPGPEEDFPISCGGLLEVFWKPPQSGPWRACGVLLLFGPGPFFAKVAGHNDIPPFWRPLLVINLERFGIQKPEFQPSASAVVIGFRPELG